MTAETARDRVDELRRARMKLPRMRNWQRQPAKGFEQKSRGCIRSKMKENLAKRTEGSVAGACVLRDCVDIVPFLCGHYLRMGFAHVAFVDDGSTDGTFELLQGIAKRTARVSVRQVRDDAFEQPARMTEVVNELIAAGHSIVVPFDSDEFWDASADTFRSSLAPLQEGLIAGRWVNFVQQRKVQTSTPFGLFRVNHRAPALPEAGKDTVTTRRSSFVCVADKKIAIKSERPVEIVRGQHGLTGGPEEICPTELEIFHIPIRSREELVRRGVKLEQRMARVRQSPEQSWQSAFFSEAIAGGGLDALWAAHSCDTGGRIDIYGKSLAISRDLRLRRLLLGATWNYLTRVRLSMRGGK